MKIRWLRVTGLLLLILIFVAWVMPGRARAQLFGGIVHDPIQHGMHAANWITQLRKMQDQFDKLRERVRQWDDDFSQLWGVRGGARHTVLRTMDQVLYAGEKPWDDILSTGEQIYNDLNRVTRSPRSGFGTVKTVRDNFTFVRPSLDRYRFLAPAVKDYYRALGNLSSEGLYVSARSYNAGETLWKDAEKLNEYARDTSPAGMAKTQAFAASVSTYAQGYQLETMNRILRQLAYQNMQRENEQRMALQASAAVQEALVATYSDIPVRAHLIN